MEKRINKKIHQFFLDFKQDIKNEFDKYPDMDRTHYSSILQFVYDYPNVEIDKTDLTKRKRVKNIVPLHERCCALRANCEQCTRRKKDGSDYCGTHIKGRPHGEVWAQDINGIIYFIDHNNNVYDHSDIINGVVNPKVLAKYEKIGENYIIPNIFDE